MKFKATWAVTVEMEVTDAMVDEAMSADWKKYYYDLRSKIEVAEHLSYNAVVNGVRDFTMLDGFAHTKKDDIKVLKVDSYMEECNEVK